MVLTTGVITEPRFRPATGDSPAIIPLRGVLSRRPRAQETGRARDEEVIGLSCFVSQTQTVTVSIELPPYVESLLREVAKERGVSLEEIVAAKLAEQLQDELDVAAACRAREEDDLATTR